MKSKIPFIILIILIIFLSVYIIFLKSDNKKDYNKPNDTIDEASDMDITVGGSYEISGKYLCITVDTKEDVELILNGASINCNDAPSINIKEKNTVNITLKKENSIISNIEKDGAIYTKGNLIIGGEGTLNIEATNDGIYANKDIIINNGKFTINSLDDAIHANGMIEVNNGNFIIIAHEGLEATYVKINDGIFNINALDDGINAGNKSKAYPVKIEINGGEINIDMKNGDTDAIDSNGDLSITGGKINIKSATPFDYDGTLIYTGGTIIVNDKEFNF